MKRGYTILENEFTAEEKRKKFLYELKDMLVGAAFPLMLMLVLSASIISFVSATDELPLKIVILILGELALAGTYVVFGRQNGTVAIRRSVQNKMKCEIGTDDLKAKLRTGEYALYKGFLIGFISCVPYILFQIIGSAAPNSVCDFMLQYAFGWAFYPFNLASLPTWLNLFWVIPLSCVHAAAYYWGASREIKKQKTIEKAQEIKDKRKGK